MSKVERMGLTENLEGIAVGPKVSSVPEPGTMLLLGSGLIGLGGFARRKFKK